MDQVAGEVGADRSHFPAHKRCGQGQVRAEHSGFPRPRNVRCDSSGCRPPACTGLPVPRRRAPASLRARSAATSCSPRRRSARALRKSRPWRRTPRDAPPSSTCRCGSAATAPRNPSPLVRPAGRCGHRHAAGRPADPVQAASAPASCAPARCRRHLGRRPTGSMLPARRCCAHSPAPHSTAAPIVLHRGNARRSLPVHCRRVSHRRRRQLAVRARSAPRCCQARRAALPPPGRRGSPRRTPEPSRGRKTTPWSGRPRNGASFQ